MASGVLIAGCEPRFRATRPCSVRADRCPAMPTLLTEVTTRHGTSALPPKGGHRPRCLPCPLWVKSGHSTIAHKGPLLTRSGHAASRYSGVMKRSLIFHLQQPPASLSKLALACQQRSHYPQPVRHRGDPNADQSDRAALYRLPDAVLEAGDALPSNTSSSRWLRTRSCSAPRKR